MRRKSYNHAKECAKFLLIRHIGICRIAKISMSVGPRTAGGKSRWGQGASQQQRNKWHNFYNTIIPMSSWHLYQSIALTSAISGLPFFCHLLLRTIFISGFSPLREVIPHPRFRSLKMSGAKSDDGINNYIDKLALICINSNRKQLVARSVGKSVYFTPGGKREPGETDDEALRRECMEELSVNLSTLTNTTASIEP